MRSGEVLSKFGVKVLKPTIEQLGTIETDLVHLSAKILRLGFLG
jgi:hypothetical protein